MADIDNHIQQLNGYFNFLEKINKKLTLKYDIDRNGRIEDDLETSGSLQDKAQSAMLQLELKEKKQMLELRQEWSNFLGIVLIIILIFEIFITIMVGLKVLIFEDEWFIRIIILGGFAQILVMPFTVASFLFNKNSPLSNGNNK